MQVKKAVGRNASTLRYDVLSALGITALAASKHHQRLILRLMVLITTRYNWQTNELSMGRAEMARLWHVNERTVKRELAKLRTHGWLTVKRAGVKGRVTVYALDLGVLLAATEPAWETIGPDFVARMGAGQAAPPEPAANVIPFQTAAPQPDVGQDAWGKALASLRRDDPALANAWFARLEALGFEDNCATLLAPTRFVADYVSTHLSQHLLAALSAADPSLHKVLVVSRDGSA